MQSASAAGRFEPLQYRSADRFVLHSHPVFATLNPMTSHSPIYRLGLPVWAVNAWVGSLYSSSKRDKWLPEYSSVFGCVEGNSTFYGIPAVETAQRWVDSTADGFRFVLKFPREVSHELTLDKRRFHAEPFLQILETLATGDRLGPAFLQLPPYYSPDRLEELARFLDWLPACFAYAVEVRHEGFFAANTAEQEFDQMLRERSVDRVLFDSRALYSKPPSDEAEQTSQGRKPNLPFRQTVTGRTPILRLIGRNDWREAERWIDEWAARIAEWVEQGLTPYVFTHSPDDSFAPVMARAFHESLRRQRAETPPLSDWPGESTPRRPVQKQLF